MLKYKLPLKLFDVYLYNQKVLLFFLDNIMYTSQRFKTVRNVYKFITGIMYNVQ